jgi:predicted DCC family thiol-disulfide oxidoreductase YuxK
MNKPYFPVRVFYDGSCSVCAAEIEHYLRQDRDGRLVAVDISSPEFHAESFHISLDAFMHEMHVIDNAGNVYRGVEAFRAIWQAFPASPLYAALATMVSFPVINPVAHLLYKGFARIRPYLPKRRGCDSGTCSIGKNGRGPGRGRR